MCSVLMLLAKHSSVTAKLPTKHTSYPGEQCAAETKGVTVTATEQYRIKAEIHPGGSTAESQHHFQSDELIFTNSHVLCSQ